MYFQQLRLQRRERNLFARPAGHAAPGFQFQVGATQEGRGGRLPPANQRAAPREQLFKGERLDEVIVGSGINAIHPIGESVARGQPQDRRGQALLAHLTQDLEPVAVRQHPIQHQ